MSDDVSDKPMDEDLAEDEPDDDFDDGDEVEDLSDDAGVSGDKDDKEEDDEDDDDEAGANPVVAAGDDEDEPDPDEVEADLGEILRDRIAANEDDEEEENVPAPVPTGELVERQDTELHCPHCFLLIQAKTVAETGECGHCGGPIS